MSFLSEEMIIGLTGGIASGKSAVTAWLRQAGYQVLDADAIVHELQAKGGKLYAALLEHFGDEILAENGELNRKHLAELIFASPESLKLSSQLQDEIIRQELAARKQQLAETENLFFMDIPLLIEGNYKDWFDQIWLVYVNRQTQLERLMNRNHYSQEEAQQRLDSQMLLDAKRAYADVIIDNGGSLAETKSQLEEALAKLV